MSSAQSDRIPLLTPNTPDELALVTRQITRLGQPDVVRQMLGLIPSPKLTLPAPGPCRDGHPQVRGGRTGKPYCPTCLSEARARRGSDRCIRGHAREPGRRCQQCNTEHVRQKRRARVKA